MKRVFFLIVMTVFPLALGCSNDPVDSAKPDCLNGERIETESDELVCLFASGLIIDGFACPSMAPNFHPRPGGDGVCTSDPAIDDDRLDEILQEEPIPMPDMGDREPDTRVDDNQCPMAIAQGRTPGNPLANVVETTPLATVELSGAASTDPDGEVVEYQWILIEKPMNSTAGLTPSTSVAEPELFLDLAGTYVVELGVVDDEGLQNCEGRESVVEIVAGCACSVDVQLVWETPGAMMGDHANLDLHFRQSGASWNGPDDIRPGNSTAEWGEPGPSDDPSLDVDSVGTTPENVTIVPVGIDRPRTYRVGVEVVDLNGAAVAYATVRIFVDRVVTVFEDYFIISRGNPYRTSA